MKAAYLPFTLAIAVCAAACGGRVLDDDSAPGARPIAQPPADRPAPAPGKAPTGVPSDPGPTITTTDDIRVVPSTATWVSLNYRSLPPSGWDGECDQYQAEYWLIPQTRLLSGRRCVLENGTSHWVESETTLDETTSLVHVRAVLADLHEQPVPKNCGEDGEDRSLGVKSPRGSWSYKDRNSPCGPAPETRYTDNLKPLQELFESLLPPTGG